MAKFRVYLATVAYSYVDVEAEDAETALEEAFSGEYDFPFAPGFADYEFGEWTTPSELFPQDNPPQDDVEELT